MKKTITIFIFLLISISAYSQKKKSNLNTKSYSTEQALEYIEDYFKFYNADELYSNPEARKISKNIFYIKVETCGGFGGNDHCYENSYYEGIGNVKQKNESFWHSKVLVLTINSNGRYTVREKNN